MKTGSQAWETYTELKLLHVKSEKVPEMQNNYIFIFLWFQIAEH